MSAVDDFRADIRKRDDEIERLRHVYGQEFGRRLELENRLLQTECALSPARAMVAMHPKTHKERHWWQYAPCHHSLFVELRAALERLDESQKQETA